MASLFCRVFRSAVCATRRTFAHLSPASPVLEASLVGPERARENSLSRSKGQGKGSMLRSFQCSSMAPPPRTGRRRAKKTPRRKEEENLDLTLLSLSPPTGPPPRPPPPPPHHHHPAKTQNTTDQLFLLAASLAGSALVMKFALDQLNPNADSKKAAKHKKKEIARRLGLPPGSIETNSYEDVISLEVVTNDNLDVGGLHDVGGLDDIKVALHQKVIAPLREPALFRSSLLRQAKGVLLFGPPGTGKTMLAKALAAESGACFVNVRASTLQSKWFGETNKLVTAVFTLGESFFVSSFFLSPSVFGFTSFLFASLFFSLLFSFSPFPFRLPSKA